jgi:hypothetical protein
VKRLLLVGTLLACALPALAGSLPKHAVKKHLYSTAHAVMVAAINLPATQVCDVNGNCALISGGALQTTSSGGGTQNVTGTGSAGSAAPGVVSVQGIAGGTNLNIIGNVTAVGTGTGGALFTNVVGSGGTGTAAAQYLPGYPDQQEISSSIVTATTTQVITGNAGQNIYLWFAGMIATGTNSSAFGGYKYGTGTTCGTGTVTLWNGVDAIGNTQGQWTFHYAGAVDQAVGANIVPAAIPYVIPAGNSVCFTTSGTTISVETVLIYAQH